MEHKRRIINWEELKLTYTTDPAVSLRGLARTYEISYRQLWTKSREENWPEQRQANLAEIASEVRRIAARKLARVAIENTLILLKRYAASREKIFKMLEAEFSQPPDALTLVEEIVEKTSLPKTPEGAQTADQTKKTQKRRKLTCDHRFAETILKMEVELLGSLVGNLAALCFEQAGKIEIDIGGVHN